MEQERLSKGIWIPIEIWKDNNLTWNEKILFLEIDSYTSKDRDCFFSNEYIAQLLGINETNANKTLSSLIQKGYVVKTKFDGRRRYVKTALSYSTTLPCREQQPSHAYDSNIINNNIKQSNKTNNKEKEIKKESLFEDCWKAYRRKGSKKKAKEQWMKMKTSEFDMVMPHIKAYVATRELVYQKDFERYIRDRTFMTAVFKGNSVIYDPTTHDNGVYQPATDGAIKWDDRSQCYIYISMFFGYIPDGYDDDNRPDGATIMLNNSCKRIRWNATTKQWEEIVCTNTK